MRSPKTYCFPYLLKTT